MLDTILFDLDGTLLPMDQGQFTQVYFSELANAVCPLGYDREQLIGAVWHGTKAMIQNEGRRTNRDVFWDDFAAIFGDGARAHEPHMDAFYSGPFHTAQRATLPRHSLKPLIAGLRQRGYTLALTTNPVFPLPGVATRLSWIGLAPGDFHLVTSYETFHYCKPNVKYYEEVLQKLGKAPENCLMVGNDVAEDMVARQLGLSVLLVTDHLEHCQGADLSAYPQATFAEIEARLAALPEILPVHY